MDAVDEELESRVDKVDLLAPTYFVPRRRIAEFNPIAVVFEGTQAKIYLKGSFTYRLSGRDREKTAAYYTPEPLARLLVKHLLMERCKGLAADEILELKILEPAMGSAAFLVETTNQLADLYLERKQVEVGQVYRVLLPFVVVIVLCHMHAIDVRCCFCYAGCIMRAQIENCEM